jgi:hypothetical protein
MSLSRHTRHLLVHLALLGPGILQGAGASATAQEDQLFKGQSPHQGAGGAAVKVHRARLEGYSDLGGGNAAAMARLKADVQHCTAANKGRVKPTTSWPQYRSAVRSDEYVAANRRIVYSSTLGYVVHPEDCSLIGAVVSSAELTSDKGICQIDMTTNRGGRLRSQGGHADAPLPKPASLNRDDVMKQMAQSGNGGDG